MSAQYTPGPWKFLPVMGGGVMAARWTRPAVGLPITEDRFCDDSGKWVIFADADEARAAIAKAQEGGAS